MKLCEIQLPESRRLPSRVCSTFVGGPLIIYVAQYKEGEGYQE
jgi:hypothetical protein